jgi:hypothetical protein
MGEGKVFLRRPALFCFPASAKQENTACGHAAGASGESPGAGLVQKPLRAGQRCAPNRSLRLRNETFVRISKSRTEPAEEHMSRDSRKLVVEVVFVVLAPGLVWLMLDLPPVAIGAIMAAYLLIGLVIGAAVSEGLPRRTAAGVRTRWRGKLVASLFLWALVGGLIALVHWEPLILWGQKAVLPFSVCIVLLTLGVTLLVWAGYFSAHPPAGDDCQQSPAASPADRSDLVG